MRIVEGFCEIRKLYLKKKKLFYYILLVEFWNVEILKIFLSLLGLFYAYWCGKIFKDSPGECFKRKTQLLETFIFRHKFEINRGMRRWLVKTSKEAENYLENDKTLQFINTKIACKVNYKIPTYYLKLWLSIIGFYSILYLYVYFIINTIVFTHFLNCIIN